MGKLYLLAGLAVGFIIGSAAGRQQFEKLTAKLSDVADSPAVKNAAKKADAFIAEKAPGLHDVAEAAADAVADTPGPAGATT